MRIPGSVILLMLVFAITLGAWFIRWHRIEACNADGGTAITDAWYSLDDVLDVVDVKCFNMDAE